MRTDRRSLLLGSFAALGALAVGCAPKIEDPPATPPADRLATLERDFGGRIGVFAIDTSTNSTLGYRADERFLMCSTVKTFVTSAILRRSVDEPGLLDRTIFYKQSDVLEWAPITSKHVADGMTISELCDAAIRYSDNTAVNLLILQLGGPKTTEKFLRRLGDSVTNTDRIEVALNVVDGDKDTSTPQQMATNLRVLALDHGLEPAGRDQLVTWLKGNTTGDQSIRAGVPAGWVVGDKTGSGAKGESNDIAVLWPPDRAPIVVVVFTAPSDPKSTKTKPTIAEATRIVLQGFGVR